MTQEQKNEDKQEQLRDTPWHVREVDEVVSEFDTDPERGLSASEAESRLARYGPNRIRSGEMVSWWRLLLRQVTDPLIYILLLTAAVSLYFQEYVDTSVILFVVVLNGVIGFVQEFRARKAIESLAEMTAPEGRVIRDGHQHDVPSEDIVPGDLVVLSAGNRVPADVRLLKAQDLRVDEAALTGESVPVSKQADPVAEEKAVPGDQLSMVFSGTSITRGRGRGIVVRTAEASELGNIAEQTRGMAEVKTPIQRKMHFLGKAIGFGILVLAGIIVAGGLLMGMELSEVARAAVALTVGAVPEALPIVLTIALARGVQRMAKRNAIIRSLPAVETLGSTTVIGSDKTGTLTSNQMTVKVIWTGGRRFEVDGAGFDPEGEIRGGDEGSNEKLGKAVLLTTLTGLLANEARGLPRRDDEGSNGEENEEARTQSREAGEEEDSGGDPTELALLVSAIKAGYSLKNTRAEYEQLDIIPFESDRQFMATLNDTPDGRCIFLKGSPESVLEHCNRQLNLEGDEEELDARTAREMAAALADEGYRVLGMALNYEEIDGFENDDPGTDLVFVGLQAMEDPVRAEAVDAVAAAHDAGIRVIMLTGDHARTARAIGNQLGLGNGETQAVEGKQIDDCSEEEFDRITRDVDVFARVSPDHKLKLVNQLKEQGHIVAVTGDGVNDAPALQAAHLGVAMGKGGTDVAREASDMVLANDNFASITDAVEEGRIVFSNIRKVTYFLLSTGLGLVLVILSSFFAPWPLPFLPVQVLWINLVTNGLQDVALAFEKGEPDLLKEPPRNPKEGVLNRELLWRLGWVSVLIATATLGGFWWMLQQGVSLELARSIAMTQIVFFQFFHVLNARSFHRSIFKVPLRDNPFLGISLSAAVLAHIAALHLPFMQTLFGTVPLALEHWGMVIGLGLLIIVAAEADKAFLRRPKHKKSLHGLDRERKRERAEENKEMTAEDQKETVDGKEERNTEEKGQAKADEARTERPHEEDGTAQEIQRHEEGKQESAAEYRKQTEYTREVEYGSVGGEEYRKETEYRKEIEFRRKADPDQESGNLEAVAGDRSKEPESGKARGSSAVRDDASEVRRSYLQDEQDDEPASPE